MGACRRTPSTHRAPLRNAVQPGPRRLAFAASGTSDRRRMLQTPATVRPIPGTGTGKKTPGGAGTHTGHARDTRAHTGTRNTQTNLTGTGTGTFRACPAPPVVFVPVFLTPRCLFTGTRVDGCEAGPCDLCARARPCVPCVPCVSRLPPVSFYRYPSTVVMRTVAPGWVVVRVQMLIRLRFA